MQDEPTTWYEGGDFDAETERVARQIVDSAFHVHVTIGPGLQESFYVRCLEHELRSRGLRVKREFRFPARYKDATFSTRMRVDLFVEDRVMVEAKTVEELHPVHRAQLLTYLRLTDTRLGLLINFSDTRLKGNVKRVAN